LNSLGKKFEDIACNYLKSKKYKILTRNFSVKNAEIDIIALKNNVLVFVEVKGSDKSYTKPYEKATSEKMRKVSYCGDYYIKTHTDIEFEEVRLDVISITNGKDIEHYEGIRL